MFGPLVPVNGLIVRFGSRFIRIRLTGPSGVELRDGGGLRDAVAVWQLNPGSVLFLDK